MTVKWSEAPKTAIDITKELVEKYHPQLQDARIGLVMRSEAATSQGREVLAKISKIDKKTQALMEAAGAEPVDLLIWIAEDVWMQMGNEQRQALIDHELCHVQIGENGYKLVGHDFEEFKVILERYGLWNYALLDAQPSMQQAMLPFEFDGHGSVVSVSPDVMAGAEA